MTRINRRRDHPINPLGQIPATASSGEDIAVVKAQLQTVSRVVNNLPGTGPWLYVGVDIPLLGGAMGERAVRIRRVGYDRVEIEGMLYMGDIEIGA